MLRFTADNPGTWLFHCHMEQHIPTGQMMAFALKKSQIGPIPKDVPRAGNCPVIGDVTCDDTRIAGRRPTPSMSAMVQGARALAAVLSMRVAEEDDDYHTCVPARSAPPSRAARPHTGSTRRRAPPRAASPGPSPRPTCQCACIHKR